MPPTAKAWPTPSNSIKNDACFTAKTSLHPTHAAFSDAFKSSDWVYGNGVSHQLSVVQLKTKTYDVTIKGPGGATTRKTGLKFRNPATDTLSFLNIGDGAQTTAGGTVHLDNIRLSVRTP